MKKQLFSTILILIFYIPTFMFSTPWEMGLRVYNSTNNELLSTDIRLFKESNLIYPYRQGKTSTTYIWYACNNKELNGISDINGDEVGSIEIWDPIIIDADVVDEEVFYLVISYSDQARFCELLIPANAHPDSPSGDFVVSFNTATGNFELCDNDRPAIDAGVEDLDNDQITWVNDEDDQDPDGTQMDLGAHYYHQPPAEPVNFRIRGLPGDSPRLTWNYTEADARTCNILRKLGNVQEFTLLAVVTDATSYIDNTVVITADKKFSQDACYKIRAVDDSGETSDATDPQCKAVDGPQDRRVELPTEFSLNNAFPNPFNPETTIKYDLPEQSKVHLTIFDLLGRKINTLKRKTEDAGFYSIKWNGKDENGKPLSSGMYIINIFAQSLESEEIFTQSQKVVLMK